MSKVMRLHEKISEFAPIVGIKLSPGDSIAGAVIEYADSATQAQKDAAAAALAAFDEATLDIPQYVSRYQFKRAVLDSNQLDALKAAYPNLTPEAKLYWDEADKVGRDSILITELKAQLGITDAAVDNFFKNAGKVQP